MDIRTDLIYDLDNNADRTKDIVSIAAREPSGYWIKFENSNTAYPYGDARIVWARNPEICDPSLYRISHEGQVLTNIKSIQVFKERDEFWRITFKNERSKVYLGSKLNVIKSCTESPGIESRLEYLRTLAKIRDDTSGKKDISLFPEYEKLKFIDPNSVLALYLAPEIHPIKTERCDFLIFPFGGNASQFKAVREAMENQLSIIQGPPGTGKTQTILNITANLLIKNRTMQIVSNNGSAIKNVLEKLASPKYGLDFLVAHLGKKDNRTDFLKGQTGHYPDLSSWKKEPDEFLKLEDSILQHTKELENCFEKQERLACAKQELAALELEAKYFEDTCKDEEVVKPRRRIKKITSQKLLQHLQVFERFLEKKGRIPFWYKVKSTFVLGLFQWDYYKNGISIVISYLQRTFYRVKGEELKQEIEEIQDFLCNMDAKGKMDKLTHDSMEYLRGILFKRYGGKLEREIFEESDLWKRSAAILREYPIALSTAFSSQKGLKNITYDYVIMDEASQADIATGALPFSNGRNAVVVGDLKQLSSIIKQEAETPSRKVLEAFAMPTEYSNAEQNFLSSICAVFSNAPQTLLREHYRCHPKIIEFCNQKFYQGELVIMTEDHGEPDVLLVRRTAKGNHCKKEQGRRINQRQIDEFIERVLPNFTDVSSQEIGVIAPYRYHTDILASKLKEKEIKADIEADTVHAFQGREKDSITFMTVADRVTPFSDESSLLNVAITRAKKNFCLIVSGEEQPNGSNIQELIDYIRYNRFEIVDSEIHSVFDLLYQQYTEERLAYLQAHKRISQYDSENLLYGELMEILSNFSGFSLRVACHQQLRLIFRNVEKLTEEERLYVSRPGTHVDFYIYNFVSKQPVLAIEVDGFNFHKPGSKQAERDKLKDSIFQKYNVPLLRLPTNGSGERVKIEQSLKTSLGIE